MLCNIDCDTSRAFSSWMRVACMAEYARYPTATAPTTAAPTPPMAAPAAAVPPVPVPAAAAEAAFWSSALTLQVPWALAQGRAVIVDLPQALGGRGADAGMAGTQDLSA